MFARNISRLSLFGVGAAGFVGGFWTDKLFRNYGGVQAAGPIISEGVIPLDGGDGGFLSKTKPTRSSQVGRRKLFFH